MYVKSPLRDCVKSGQIVLIFESVFVMPELRQCSQYILNFCQNYNFLRDQQLQKCRTQFYEASLIFWVSIFKLSLFFLFEWCMTFFSSLSWLSTVCIRDSDFTLVKEAPSHFWPPLKRVVFFEAAGAVAKIGSNLKLNHHCLFKLVKFIDTHGHKFFSRDVRWWR